MDRYRKIVVPTDFSIASEDAAERAREIAELNPGATITLLYVVVTRPFAPVAKDPKTHEPMVEPAVRETIEKELERIRDDNLAGFAETHTAITLARNAALGIVDWATDNGQDLIVMTKRGHGGLATPLIGSTTERVVRHARCAVMTFRSARLDASVVDDGDDG